MEEIEEPLLRDAQENASAAPSSPGKKDGEDPRSSPGKKDGKDGGDPVAATQSGEDTQLAALNAKNPDRLINPNKKIPQAPVQLRPLDADSLADAAEVFAREQRDTEFRVAAELFAVKARAFANNPEDPVAADDFIQVSRVLNDAGVSTPHPGDVLDIVRAAHMVLSMRQNPAQPPIWSHRTTSNKPKFNEDFSWRRRGSPTSDQERLPFMQCLRAAISAPIHSAEQKALREQAATFAKSAGGSSMAAAADAFCRAADQFSAKNDRKKKVIDTELSKAAMNLHSVALRGPSSEAALASIAIELTSDAQLILLSDTETKPRLFFSWRKRVSSAFIPQDVTRPSFVQRLWAAISTPEPILPIHAEREEKLVGKREVVYALALGAPVAILTSAAGLHVFPDAWAWIAGGSLGVWILAAGGTVLNQYAQTGWERLAARHLGRLGVLGAAVLFSFFTHIVFFPSASWGFWLLLGIAAVILVIPWILACTRGDDVAAMPKSVIAGDAAGWIGKSEMPRGGLAPGRRRTA